MRSSKASAKQGATHVAAGLDLKLNYIKGRHLRFSRQEAVGINARDILIGYC